jgi:hypothetical protein
MIVDAFALLLSLSPNGRAGGGPDAAASPSVVPADGSLDQTGSALSVAGASSSLRAG